MKLSHKTEGSGAEWSEVLTLEVGADPGVVADQEPVQDVTGGVSRNPGEVF